MKRRSAPACPESLARLDSLVKLIHSSHMKIGDRWVPVMNWHIDKAGTAPASPPSHGPQGTETEP